MSNLELFTHVPLFGHPNLCGEELINWALKNRGQAILIFEPFTPFKKHTFRVAGLQPYQIGAVCVALNPLFGFDHFHRQKK